MGEIADALKKANAERDRAQRAAATQPVPQDAELEAEAVAAGWSADASAPAPRRPASAPATPTHAPPEGEPELDARDDDLPQIELDGEPPHVDHTRHLALRLKSEMEERGARSVLVASALRNEGKTTVSCNLAIALASVSSGRGIALVDLDLRNPSICRRLGITPHRGIDEAILGRIPLDEACHPLSGPRIDVYPASKPRPAAHEFLIGDGFQRVMKELHARYELVVIDSPPTLLVPDSTLILRHADSCVTVAHTGVTRVRMYRKMLSTLPADQVVGKILNAAPAEKHQRDYYAYGYGADEGHESTSKEDRS